MSDSRLVIFGLGYSGSAVARAAVDAGFHVSATSRDIAGAGRLEGVQIVAFDAAEAALRTATHVLATAPPGEAGDPVLLRYAGDLAKSSALRWAGYLSTTGVYGDRGGGWVDEATPLGAVAPRARRRVAAEQAWSTLSARVAVDLFRVAGIYGPGRSILDDLRAGKARRVIKPGHAFGRIHRDDIAGAVLAAMQQTVPPHSLKPGVRILHLADDLPAESAAVVEEGARLLGLAPPPAVAYADAADGMSDMARSFWADNRKVASRLTQQALAYRWRYPDYRSGLAGILAEERGQRPDEPREVGRP